VTGSQVTKADVFDAGDWRPRYWTLACVSTFHLILAATFITATPKLPEPPVFNVVDVVTFPDGTRSDPASSVPVDAIAEQKREAEPEAQVPKIRVDPRFGPRPSDKRVPPPPVVLPPLPLPAPASEPVTTSDPQPPLPVPVPAPVPPPPKAPPEPVREAITAPTPVPVPVQAPVEPIPARVTNPTPTLVQPPPTPLNIRADKLKINQNRALKPVQTPSLTLPPLQSASPAPLSPAPSPQAVPDSTPVQQPSRPRSPPPPAFSGAAPTPLTPAKQTRALPQVQVPRVRAQDIAIPDVQLATPAAPAASAGPSGPSGVTSLAPTGGGSNGGQNASGAGGGRTSGGAATGSGGAASGSGAGGTSAGGSPTSPQSGTNGGSGTGASGILPRRPGGASVRQEFPRDDTSLLGRMDKTFDCSRVGRERDARCPEWTPMEGRNGRGAAPIPVPVPQGLPKLRAPAGTNPLPVCPPGTPGSQMGLSCLPSREGPGIPKQ
jgi:hypothetical protein